MGGFKDCHIGEKHKQDSSGFEMCPKGDISAYCIEVE